MHQPHPLFGLMGDIKVWMCCRSNQLVCISMARFSCFLVLLLLHVVAAHDLGLLQQLAVESESILFDYVLIINKVFH